MNKCTSCKRQIKPFITKKCSECGAIYCESCAKKTKNICPNCYSNLEYGE